MWSETAAQLHLKSGWPRIFPLFQTSCKPQPKSTHGAEVKLVFMTVVSSGNGATAPGIRIPWLSNAIYLMLHN